MEITSACDLMAGERVTGAAFHARGILGIQKNPTTCRITDSLECRCECVRIGSAWFRGLRLPISEKKLQFHHFLLLRTFARVPAGAFLFNLI